MDKKKQTVMDQREQTVMDQREQTVVGQREQTVNARGQLRVNTTHNHLLVLTTPTQCPRSQRYANTGSV